ncbi:GIY-YIG nuclease family protein [Sinomicrobium oceani]|uniref:GIY-YIG nuclease family protein n=1 Tax=Sinomicrobium oceani TaxID=1150368 RepID=UPI00227C6AB9|nr:GIY-YIG nuclease family protein [Sinomicrobium oceani]
MHYVYIIFSESLNRFYVGETIDLNKRLAEHNEGIYTRSYTKKAQNWKLFFTIGCESKTQAIQIEKHIKRMKSVIYIKNLKLYPEIAERLKEKYN